MIIADRTTTSTLRSANNEKSLKSDSQLPKKFIIIFSMIALQK